MHQHVDFHAIWRHWLNYRHLQPGCNVLFLTILHGKRASNRRIPRKTDTPFRQNLGPSIHGIPERSREKRSTVNGNRCQVVDTSLRRRRTFPNFLFCSRIFVYFLLVRGLSSSPNKPMIRQLEPDMSTCQKSPPKIQLTKFTKMGKIARRLCASNSSKR